MSWTPVYTNSNTTDRVPYKILTNPNGDKLVVVQGLYSANYANHRIYRSSDYGTTWSNYNSLPGVMEIVADDTLQYIVAYTYSSNRLYRSTNYGETFIELTNSPNALWRAIVSNSTGQYLVAGHGSNSAQRGLYYSLDYGSTWTSSSPTNRINWQNLVSSSNGKYVFASGSGNNPGSNSESHEYISSDYGVSYTEITSSIHPSSLACDSTGKYVYATSFMDNQIYSLYNYSTTWTNINADTTNDQVYSSISTDSTGQYVLAYDSSLYEYYYSSDYGSTWIMQLSLDNYGSIPTISKNAYYSYLIEESSPYKLYRYFNESVQPHDPVIPVTTTVACFKEDTKILTNKGYILIQDLRKGNLVKTLEDGYKPIDMIGYRTFEHNPTNERIKDQLYKCTSDKFPEIFADLVMTGCHSILVDEFENENQKENTIKINGDIYITDNYYRLPACVDERTSVYEIPGTYTIYHLALENDDYYMNYGIYANGLMVETCSKRFMKEYSNMSLIN